MLRVGVRAARHEGGRDGLLHRVDGCPGAHIRLALEADGLVGRFLGQAVGIHHHVGEVHIFARAMVEVVASDGKGIAVAAEDKHIQILPGERNTGGKERRAAVDVVCAVCLHKIREPAAAADAGRGGELRAGRGLDELSANTEKSL